MEVAECTKIVLSRIQEIEPKDVTKIIGYLLLQHNQEEICAYAYGPDGLIHSLISEAKAFLSSSPSPLGSLATSQLACMPSSTVSRSFSSPSSFRVAAPRWVPYLPTNRQPAARNLEHPLPVHNELAGGVHNQADFLNVDEQLQALGPDFFCNYYHPDALAGSCLGSSAGMRSPSGVPGFASRTCHYSDGGLCKNGINCSYTHGQGLADCFSTIYNQNMNEQDNKDHVFAPGSLEKLELEIGELLRAGGGEPVSIAVLPMVYHEMYGRMLQAEGYLSESQRHGKTGYNLTKLLARLRNIRLIDRPNGQHSVVLVEDYVKYMDCRNERSDSRALPGSSHQIYLTFPAESTFTEVDVADYFKQYGPVHDVRIPRQEKRMFGFVSFIYPETVKLILAKGHPHYISGARVLVKPYKEKSKMNGRKYTEKIEIPMYCPRYCEMDPYLNSIPRAFQRIQEHEDFLEFERMRLSELQLNPKPIPHHYFVNRTDEFRFSEDHLGAWSVPEKYSMTAEKLMHRSNSFSDQDSDHIELPDSPFASPR